MADIDELVFSAVENQNTSIFDFDYSVGNIKIVEVQFDFFIDFRFDGIVKSGEQNGG